MSPRWYDLFPIRPGWMGAVASPRGLVALALPAPTPESALERLRPHLRGAELRPGAFADLQARLERYFAGEPMGWSDLPLDLEGSPPFFRRAWEACRSIPPGETRSYAWVAERAGNPRAVRAVGQAMARNPLPLLIPCHRVVASDGSLHRYGGGLDLKALLLDLERRARAQRA